MADQPGPGDRIAVFFHYCEVNQGYRDNLIFFLATAYLPNVDFFIIIADGCSVELPAKDNIEYIHTENRNYDFGGYAEAISRLGSAQDYDFYIFINSSVRGPFLPFGFDAAWTTLFTDLFSDEVKLVGSTINILSYETVQSIRFRELFHFPEPLSHVQTTAYALDKESLQHLIDMEFYNEPRRLARNDVICAYEIRLSQEIKKNGWNMKCFFPEYNEIDFREPHTDVNPTSKFGDIVFENAYFGRTALPSEFVFVKTNRAVLSEHSLACHTLTALRGHASELGNWGEAVGLLQRSFAQISSGVGPR